MFSFPPKISLAQIPTPMMPLKRLSDVWDIDLLVKMDSLTGLEMSGNKVRKLEYLLAEATQQGCDTIITCGATTSNHARATAIAARRLGMGITLILAGDTPQAAHGNLQLDLLVGARIQYITWEDYSRSIGEILDRTAQELRMEGKKPYVIPTGGSNAVGLMGYVEAVQEMANQCEKARWKPDFIICAVGSGGTYAGLYLGNELFGLTEQIWGILVCGTVESFREKIARDVEEASKKNQIPVPKFDKIVLIDGYYGTGYAKTNSAQLQLIRQTAEWEGLILDPVYTGKAFYGLAQERMKGRIPAGSKVLFLHTGGIYGLSAFTQDMAREWPNPVYWKNDPIL